MADDGLLRQLSDEPSQSTLFLPFDPFVFEILDCLLVIGFGLEQCFKQISATSYPFINRRRLPPYPYNIRQGLDKGGKTSEHGGLIHVGIPRADILPHRIAAFGQHPAQYHAFYRLLPGEQLIRAAAHFSVQTPTDVQIGNHVVQKRQIVLSQSETAQHGRGF